MTFSSSSHSTQGGGIGGFGGGFPGGGHGGGGGFPGKCVYVNYNRLRNRASPANESYKNDC